MAIMLPVGPGGLFGDSSLQGAPESPPIDTTNSISSDGGATNDNSPNSTGTLSGTGDSDSFQDTLKKTQKEHGPRPPAKDSQNPTALPLGATIPLPIQAQQTALSFAKLSQAELDSKAAAESAGAQVAAVVGTAAATQLAAEHAAGQGSVEAQDSAESVKAEAESSQSDEAQASSDSHALSSVSETLAHADAVTEATRESAKDSDAGAQGGSSGQPPQLNWVHPSAIASSPAAPTATADASVAGAGMAERIGVVRQIANQIASSTPIPVGVQHTVTINIHPEHWGELTINLTMETPTGEGASGTASGPLTATIVAQTSAVRDALVGQSKDLQNALESAGIKLQKLDIITAGAATGTVAAGHSASQSGFDSNSKSGSSGQQGQQPHSNGTSQDASGGQGQRSNQGFASQFGDSSQNQPRGGWLPSVSPAAASPAPESFTPIGLVEATSSGAAGSGLNVLA